MSKTAVVTGCTGFVASELVQQLLSQGWAVRGTVRGSTSSERATALQAALQKAQLPDGALQRFSLHVADLLQPGAVDRIVAGADYVFHVASPFQVEVGNAEEDLLRPAVEGTRNLMQSVVLHKATIKRVVLTSSVAAVHDCHCKQAPSQGELYTENDFNTTSTPDKEAYWVSKVRAEQTAWAVAREHGIDLITILPEFIMGPVLTLPAARSSLSSAFFKGFLEPSEGGPPSGSWIFSDVREVAAAHILAATKPAAKGRYIVACDDKLDAQGVAKILKEHFPSWHIADGQPAGDLTYNLVNSKAKEELGLQIRPTAQTLVDMAQSLIDIGFAKPKARA